MVGVVALCTWIMGLPNQPSFVGLSGYTINAIYSSSDIPSQIIAGTDTGLFAVNINGNQCDTLLTGFKVVDIVGTATNQDTILIALGLPLSGILKSCNGGTTWQAADSGIFHNSETGITAIKMDPQNHNILYAGTSGIMAGGLYKSYNYGESWEEIENNIHFFDGVIDIAINKNQPENIYVSTNQTGAVLKSSDGGGTWLTLSVPWYEAGLPNIEIDPIYNPFTPTRIFAGVWGYGFAKSTDDGVNWETQGSILGSQLASYRVVAIPDMSVRDIIYLGLDGGLYSGRLLYSEDAGTNWSSLSDSLSVISLLSDSGTGNLLIGTRTGMYMLASQTSISDESPGNTTMFDVGIYPNPSNNNFQISISNHVINPVFLDFFDLSGKQVRSAILTSNNGEYQRYTWNLRNQSGEMLSSGIYFCRIRSGHFIKNIKLTAIY